MKVSKLLIPLMLLFCAGIAESQVQYPKGSLSGPTLVASLPSPGNSNILWDVRDANSATDCTVGSGTTRVVCKWNGSAYAVVGSGGGGTATDITVATTTVTGGADKSILYDNAGILGEYSISGSGTAIPTTTGATVTNYTITTPTELQTPFGTSLPGSPLKADQFLRSIGPVTITNATNATPIVITAPSHGFSTGFRVSIAGIVGNTAANNLTWTVTVTDANTFSLNGSTGNGAYTSGGTAVHRSVWVSGVVGEQVQELLATDLVPILSGGTGTGSTLVGLVRGNASAMTAAEISGDATTSGSNALTLATVNGNVGPFGSATTSLAATVNAKGLITAISSQTVTPAESSITFTDITTNNSSTSKHGFLLKLDNNAAHYMDGTGAWTTPGGGASGANPTASVGLSAVNGSASTFLRSDGAPALDVTIAPTWTATHTFQQAVAASSLDGAVLSTSATATVGAQKQSTALHYIASGWKTNSTAAAQTIDFRNELIPLQGAAKPDAYLTTSIQTNAGGYTVGLKQGFQPQSTAFYAFYGGGVTPSTTNYNILNKTDGSTLELSTTSGGSVYIEASGTAIATFNPTSVVFAQPVTFLGTSSSFPALKRSGTTLQHRLADDSADGPMSASNGTFSGSLVIGSGTAILKHLSATATLDFGSLVAAGCEDLTLTVTGAAAGDTVALGVPDGSTVTNGAYSAWVSATNTVKIKFCTVISGDPASGSFRADVWQH